MATTGGDLDLALPALDDGQANGQLWADKLNDNSQTIDNAVTLLNGILANSGVVQRQVVRYMPVAANIMTDVMAPVNGASTVFVPTDAANIIDIKYQCHLAAVGANQGLVSLRGLNGAAIVGKGTCDVWRDGSLSFWCSEVAGSTASRVYSIAGRRYSASYPSKLHETQLSEGATANVLVLAVLEIVESLP